MKPGKFSQFVDYYQHSRNLFLVQTQLGDIRCGMATSRLFNVALCWLLTAILVLAASEAILDHDYRRLFWGFVVLILVWGVGTLLNFVIFPPVFRLLSRLTSKHGKANTKPDDHTP
jgi:hypothetical protein